MHINIIINIVIVYINYNSFVRFIKNVNIEEMKWAVCIVYGVELSLIKTRSSKGKNTF